MKKILALLLALLMILSLAACSSKDEPSNDDKTPTVIEETEDADDAEADPDEIESEDADVEVGDDFELNIKEDDQKIIWEVENTTIVYYHDGQDVTGYEAYIETSSAADAKVAIDVYQKNAEQDDTIDEVSRKGKYIYIKYNKSGFEYVTYDELKETSDMLKSLYSK